MNYDKDIKKAFIKKYLKDIMKLMDIPITESNRDTPERVAKMWTDELFLNRNNDNMEKLISAIKVFPNEYGNELVIVKDIGFNSMCEHHWLPFSGKVTLGYVPKDVVVGLSKIPRIVKYFSKKPQLQEQLTKEIGEFFYEIVKPNAVFVEVQAEHQCVSCRGIECDCSTKTYYKKVEKGYEKYYEEFKERMKD